MDCRKCGAPLPGVSVTCRYCGAVNDLDLHDRGVRPVGAGERLCPHCREALERLQVSVGTGIELDRCARCMGIFFDPGELSSVLSQADTQREHVDRQRLRALTELAASESARPVRYVPCPDCGNLMNRTVYGRRSGVVVDRCRDHGTWLDGGELKRLVEWVRAGGRRHQRELEREEVADLERRRSAAAQPATGSILTESTAGSSGWGSWVLADALVALGELMFRRR